MTKQEMLEFVNEYYPVPIQKYWQPSDYDMKYRFNTPRKMKKLESVKAKEDLKLLQSFNEELQHRNNVLIIIDDIETLPERLKDLFYTTLKNQVLYDIKTRETFSQNKEAFYEEFGKKDEKCYSKSAAASYASELVRAYKEHYNDEQKRYYRSFDDRDLQYYKNMIYNFDNINMDEFYEKATRYLELRKLAEQTLSPIECLKHGSKKIEEIIMGIRKVLNGDPEHCEYDAHWGVGNEFNGVVSRGETKASFKSFLAGGWNIQRLHIRFRITLLKN